MVNVRLDKELEDKLKKYASKQQKTKSSIVKEALIAYLKDVDDDKSAFELGKDLFGQAASRRTDTSTKYKSYLKTKLSGKNTH